MEESLKIKEIADRLRLLPRRVLWELLNRWGGLALPDHFHKLAEAVYRRRLPESDLEQVEAWLAYGTQNVLRSLRIASLQERHYDTPEYQEMTTAYDTLRGFLFNRPKDIKFEITHAPDGKAMTIRGWWSLFYRQVQSSVLWRKAMECLRLGALQTDTETLLFLKLLSYLQQEHIASLEARLMDNSSRPLYMFTPPGADGSPPVITQVTPPKTSIPGYTFVVSNDGGKTCVAVRDYLEDAMDYLKAQNSGGLTDYAVVVKGKIV